MHLTQKKIHLVLALPGSGKTQKFLAAAKGLIKSGAKILYSVPTKALANEIIARLPSGITATRIDSDNKTPVNTTRMLNDALVPTSGSNFIICQHATLHACSLQHLKDWTLVVDETPTILETPSYTFTKEQFEKINYIEVVDRRIQIKKGMRNSLLKEISECSASMSDSHRTNASTVSKPVHDIFSALADEDFVFHGLGKANDAEKADSDSTAIAGTETVRIIRENDFFRRFSATRETHLLTATVEGGLFDYYAKRNGFRYGESIFQPKKRTKFPVTRIYPMLTRNNTFSKSLAVAENESQPGIKNLNVMVARVLEKIGDDTCLFFTHEWGQVFYDSRIIICKVDSRGIDSLKEHHNAMVAIHGNPTAPERRSLEYIAKKHGSSLAELTQAWKVTKKFEVALQSVFRTGLRKTYLHDGSEFTCEKEICLYVQDYEAVDYLKRFLPTAIIDESLAACYKTEKKRGRRQHPNKPMMIRMINARHTTEEIRKETGLSRKTICEERRLLGIPSKPKNFR
jgi:hypothetical protein